MKKLFYPIFSTLEQALQIFTTKLAGALAKSEQKRLKNYLINYFIQKFDVNMAESETTNAFDYKSFNAFFIPFENSLLLRPRRLNASKATP